MQLIRFYCPGDACHLGVRSDGLIFDLTAAARDLLNAEVTTPTWFMTAGRGLEAAGQLLAHARTKGFKHDSSEPLQLDVPIRDVPKLLALAGNYRKHIVESGFEDPFGHGLITPQVFLKPPSTTLNAPQAPVYLRKNNVFLDWEAELAVVIGTGGRDIPRAEAMSHVFGYTVINDISERSFNAGLENRNVREFDKFFDWLIGKWFDGSAPLGPALVTSDEIGDPHHLGVRLRLNGELMQDGNTSAMIFDVPASIEYISSVTALEPGDVIAMGTPDGVGMARGIRLKAGDKLCAEIDGIGALENVVCDGEALA
jgi:2-keto-4-pentenoate hydratase/2-oxohepta-3-ene-1,7-dioic acid hydratase in catechol pathway